MKISKRRQPTDFGASNDDRRARVASLAAGAELDAPPAPPVDLAAAAPQTIDPPARPVEAKPPPAWPLYLTAFAVAALWALGPIAFAVGYRSATAPLQNDHFALLVFGLLAVGPAALVFGVAYFVRQGQLLAAAARHARDAEASLLTPALRAAGQAGEVTKAVREEIAAAAQAADLALERLTALRQALAAESASLSQASQASLASAQQLSNELGRERGELQALAQGLDAQTQRAAETLDQQARKVVDISGAAEAQLREAEAALATRTAGLGAVAAEASAAARTAGEDLSRHVARLETAGIGVAEQVRAVEGGLAEQRAALVTLSHALRADHEAFSSEADAHALRLDDFIGGARRAAAEMNERSVQAGEALRGLIAEAAERFGQFSELAQRERTSVGLAAAESLDQLRRAAGDQRARLEGESREAIEALERAAEETRKASARHAVAAREQVEQLSEAAFAAGQKANQVFEARLEEARALVEESSRIVGEAGAAAARKLDEGAAAARETLAELVAMMEALEARARQLPAEAQAQAEGVRASVTQGMEALMAHARHTAQEAQAIDAAFQQRVRRNFDMLSEAVRLMGTVAAAPPPALPTEPPPLPPAAPASAAFPSAYAAPKLVTPSPATAAAEPAEPSPPAGTDGAALAERLGLRPRLKLTPTASDEEFSAIFEAAGGAKPAATASDADEDADEDEPAETWTWKDLLASLKATDEAGEAEEGELGAELAKMGIEPDKLLPQPRIEQIAAAIQTGDLDGARQVVKRLAGAGARRIVRRLFTDEPLMAKAQGFVGRYQSLVDDAVARDPEGFLLASLLDSGVGRTYLLLDQALGDGV